MLDKRGDAFECRLFYFAARFTVATDTLSIFAASGWLTAVSIELACFELSMFANFAAVGNLDLYHSPKASALVARFNKRHVGGRLIARIINARFRDGTTTQPVRCRRARRFKFL
jgi:hypothetical protein